MRGLVLGLICRRPVRAMNCAPMNCAAGISPLLEFVFSNKYWRETWEKAVPAFLATKCRVTLLAVLIRFRVSTTKNGHRIALASAMIARRARIQTQSLVSD
jgi:hypothetical protein